MIITIIMITITQSHNYTILILLTLSLVDNLANVTGGYFGGSLGDEQLIEATNKKVVIELAHATSRYDRLLAAYGT